MKRFTETSKWEKPWFQDLPPHLKCLWLFMCDKCDCAGVWEMNWKAASLFIGKTVTAEDLKHFAGKVAVFGGKLVVGSFVAFQYGKLSEDCRAHTPVFRALSKHSLSIGYSKAIHSLQEQVQEEEEEGKGSDEGKPAGAAPRAGGETDEAWIIGLEAMDCYRSVSVRMELGRAQAWAAANHRSCTRRFFTNWLNRATTDVRTVSTVPPQPLNGNHHEPL